MGAGKATGGKMTTTTSGTLFRHGKFGFDALSRRARLAAGAGGAFLIIGALGIGAFPVSVLHGTAERQLGEHFGAPVRIGALSRAEFFSFTPTLVVEDVSIAQPTWAGTGSLFKVRRASARTPILSLLLGDPAIRSLDIVGLEANLVRDANGKSNWEGSGDKRPDEADRELKLDALSIRDSRFSLLDAKRRLDIAGTLEAAADRSVTLRAEGRFDGVPARLIATGAPLGAAKGSASWPFSASLASPTFRLDAKGTMAGGLNMREMDIEMSTRGQTLKQLDYIIEAGLFGTQDIDFEGKVRRRGPDWFIDRLGGMIGRSTIHAKASVLKREGRTRIDATIDAPQFDFDDLADDAGLAAARVREARTGPRIIPETRINLSKIGPTDGIIRFNAPRLLIKGGSAFRSLKGDLVLEKRVLTLRNAVAGLDRGQMTGWVKVDSRGNAPLLSTELRVTGTSLDTLVGQPSMIRGPLEGLVRLQGRGDTIRAAFAGGNGKIAFVARGGAMNRAAAFILGQDLGGAIGQKLGDDDAMVPIRCAVLAFTVRQGLLTPAPLLIDTSISKGAARGRIDLDGETIALIFGGASKGDAALKLVDPIRIGGTLSSPSITLAPPGKPTGKSGGIIGAIGRSIGSALGLRKDHGKPPTPSAAPADCDALAGKALA
ncbi:hypothetical protein ATE72_03845 [Sphingopyxis sp. HXXIV]|nr:hypothetical protein ATE72_03845 [Sphingopyxis sp. HXXIV]